MKCPKDNSEMLLVKRKANMEKWVCPSCNHPVTIYSSKELKLGEILVGSDREHWL